MSLQSDRKPRFLVHLFSKFAFVLFATIYLFGCQKESTQVASKDGINEREQIDTAVHIASATYGVPEDYIHAIIHVESGHANPEIRKGGSFTHGVMQTTILTCHRYGCSNPRNIYENVMAGTQHLRDLLADERINGDFRLAAAAYNAGVRHMARGERYADRVMTARNRFN